MEQANAVAATYAALANEPALSVFQAVINTSRLQDKKLQAALSNLSIHPAQYSCLYVICSNEGLNLRELAACLHIENSTASVTVRRMEKAGLILRKPDELDSRMTRLYPTGFGWEQFEKSKQVISGFIDNCFGFLSEKEMRTLAGLLGKVAAHLEQYTPSGEPD